jgi:RES domain-containing protein
MSNSPSLASLKLAVQALPLTSIQFPIFYRSVDFKVLVTHGVKLVDGTHSGKTGGRYNPPNSLPTSYFAGSQTLASFECEQEAMILGLQTMKRNPRIICSVEISNAKVLDLTNMLVIQHLGISKQDLLGSTFEWRQLNSQRQISTTQLIGEAVRQRADADRILYPSWLTLVLPDSAIPRLENLALFMDPEDGSRARNKQVSIDIYDPTGLIP